MGGYSMQRFVALALALILVSGCQAPRQFDSGTEQKIRNSALLFVPNYQYLKEPKVIVACIDWANTTLPNIAIC